MKLYDNFFVLKFKICVLSETHIKVIEKPGSNWQVPRRWTAFGDFSHVC